MDAVEFKKAIQRLCMDRSCNECVLFDEAINDCINSIWGREAEAVAIVEKWSKEHPIMTNAQKFEEVFGEKPLCAEVDKVPRKFGNYDRTHGGGTDLLICPRYTICTEQTAIKSGDGFRCWWDEPYKGEE